MSTPSMSDLSGAYLEAIPADRTLHMRGRPVQVWDSPGDSSLGYLDASRGGSSIGRYQGPGYGGLGSCCGSSRPGWDAGMGDACCAACAAGKPCAGPAGPVQALADLGQAVARLTGFMDNPTGGFVPARGRVRRPPLRSRPAKGSFVTMADLGQAAAQHFELPGESGQKPVNLTCPGGSNITVQQATYGRNCNKPELIGNKTSVFAALCNAKGSCSGTTQAITDPDPAPGCPKSFDVDWTCDGPSSGVTQASLPPPAPSGPSSSVTTASSPAPAPAPAIFSAPPSNPVGYQRDPSAQQDNRALLDLQSQISSLKSQAPPAVQQALPPVFNITTPQAAPTGGSFISPTDFPSAPSGGITSQPWFIPAAVGAGLLVLFLASRKQSPVVIAKNWLR